MGWHRRGQVVEYLAATPPQRLHHAQQPGHQLAATTARCPACGRRDCPYAVLALDDTLAVCDHHPPAARRRTTTRAFLNFRR